MEVRTPVCIINIWTKASIPVTVLHTDRQSLHLPYNIASMGPVPRLLAFLAVALAANATASNHGALANGKIVAPCQISSN